jgi:GNAT superfamily N-acetyltransferase
MNEAVEIFFPNSPILPQQNTHTMITYTTAQSEADLQGILSLQKANLVRNLGQEEIQSQGFVTVDHTYEQLASLNAIEPHLIAKVEDEVVGYLLCMTAASKGDIPVLEPLFELFDGLSYQGRSVSSYHYLVVGQVCVAKAYRGQGVLDQAYAAYRQFFGKKYNFAITEIALTNPRSLNGHRRVGFEVIHQYTDPKSGVEWAVVLWDWQGE